MDRLTACCTFAGVSDMLAGESHLMSRQGAVQAASLFAVTVDVPASHSLIKKYARCGARPHRRPW
ncbi:hypothetical protein HanXRQr2_Chr02g0071341 [Helianthus annuus]|uniref:Uncharacterized protein n=1 Tax=Helianthus annuus TaxID=4232 RepID=A0A9K3JNP1_HELAN|nr:hypothetical protein HanXRQr2_Chr02g0071341 [Helianthus annuus]